MHLIIVIICHSVKRKGPRKPYKFFITGEPYVNPIKHYASLHNEAKAVGNFLKNINSHGHVTQNIGKNTLAKYPKDIANYLSIENSADFSGHSFRRTGATILADSGCQMMTLKRAGTLFLYDKD